jgi:hypothetical protein
VVIFFKPRGVREQRSLGNAALGCAIAPQETQAVTALNCVVVVVVVLMPFYFILVNNSLLTHTVSMLNCQVLS